MNGNGHVHANGNGHARTKAKHRARPQLAAARNTGNGISGEDVKVLHAIRGVLDKLSEKDMAKVLDYLQQSRAATDPTTASCGVIPVAATIHATV